MNVFIIPTNKIYSLEPNLANTFFLIIVIMLNAYLLVVGVVRELLHVICGGKFGILFDEGNLCGTTSILKIPNANVKLKKLMMVDIQNVLEHTQKNHKYVGRRGVVSGDAASRVDPSRLERRVWGLGRAMFFCEK